MAVGGSDSNLRCEGQAQPGLLTQFSQRLGFLYFFSLVCLFVFTPHICSQSYFVRFFWGFILHLFVVVFLNKQTCVTGIQ